MSASPFRSFGGMCWPAPGPALSEIGWLMRYRDMGKKADPADLVAASVIEAYAELIRLPAKKRDAIIRELRKGPGIVSVSSDKSVQQDEQKDSP